jgi:hypothetical protein
MTRTFVLPLTSQDNSEQAPGRTVEATVLVDAGGVCVSLDWTPGVTVHCRTTCTRDSPFGPVIGVNVTVHVSVAGPEGLQQHQTTVNQYRETHRKEHPRRTC